MNMTFSSGEGKNMIKSVDRALLLICSLLLLSGCGPTKGTGGNETAATTAPSAASPSTQPGSPVMIGGIHMFDSKQGWAMTYDQKHLLRTTTGVSNWQDVTPPAVASAGGETRQLWLTAFLDPLTAWIAVQREQGPPIIFHTTDGGHTWQRKRFEGPKAVFGSSRGINSLTFITPQLGWMLFSEGAGMNHEAMDVLQTTDGGTTWRIISVTDTTGDKPRLIPFAGHKSGPTFISSTTGWITGDVPMNNFIYLYKTEDSGITWQHQDLILSSGKQYMTVSLPPMFFHEHEGILPVSLLGAKEADSAVVVYVTHDGGKTWQMTSPASVEAGAPAVSFSDMSHGWIATNKDTRNNLTLHATSDGGAHWKQITSPLSTKIEGVSDIAFVSPTTGWILAFTENGRVLLQTTDGGGSWTQISPLAS